MSASPERQRRLPSRILVGIARAVLTIIVLIDEIARPLYRPMIGWIASLSMVARLEAAIAGLPRPAILAVLAVPFAIAEPLKLLGLVMMADGRARSGFVIFAFAHLVSFLLVERIYHAGRDKLLTYPWLAWAMAILDKVRTRALTWVRASAAYRSAMLMRDAARNWLRGLRA